MAIGTTTAIIGGAILAGGAASAKAGRKAAKKAAGAQTRAADEAINFQRESRDLIREDLEPFKKLGTTDLQSLGSLVTDPTAQFNHVQNNPFYQGLASQAKNDLFANQAAKGKVGSGGTAEALQNSLLLLGSDLLNQNITQRQNLASLGSNAVTGQANATQNAAGSISGLLTQKGNAQASGYVGAANAKIGAINNALGTATAFAGLPKKSLNL